MTIYICGDSTAASYAPERAPMTGWGQVLPEFLPGMEIINKAMAGRSTKTFVAEGRLLDVEKRLCPGDLVLIQFTHNDGNELVWRHTDPYTSFAANLELFVDTVRLRGAVPVLLTPIPCRCWREGELIDLHGAYPDAIRQVAMKRGVPLLDVNLEGMRLLREVGEENSQILYMNVAPGVYDAYPDGAKDDVHTQRAGALQYAHITAELLKKQGLV